jgi:hypothetical protein
MVQRLGKGVAGPGGIEFGPEQGQQGVPLVGTVGAGKGEIEEHAEPLGLAQETLGLRRPVTTE